MLDMEPASACLEKKIKVWDVGSATMVEREDRACFQCLDD